jgi:hypothetical protein
MYEIGLLVCVYSCFKLFACKASGCQLYLQQIMLMMILFLISLSYYLYAKISNKYIFMHFSAF